MSNWGKRFFVSFSLKMTNFGFDGHRNIVHITKGGNDQAYGDAIPALYVDGKTRNLRVVSAINDIRNFYFDYTLELGKEYDIVVSQDQVKDRTLFHIFINGELIYEVENMKPENFGTVKVYHSDPWVDSIDGVGTVLNLRILDYIPCKFFLKDNRP